MTVNRSPVNLSNSTTSYVSTYSRHIGRVGALAAALGIGLMVATSPGVASADSASVDDCAAQQHRESSE